MIIPTIHYSSFPDVEKLSATTERWSLLGRVCVLGTPPDAVARCRDYVKTFGGRIDLQIELTEPNVEQALDLLNNGACEVITDFGLLSEFCKSIPADRMIGKLSPDEPGFDSQLQQSQSLGNKVLVTGKNKESINGFPENYVQFQLNNPTSESINRLDRQWQDCLIDVEHLERQPDFLPNTISDRLTSDRPDGLWPTVIVNELGTALGLAYSNSESLCLAISNLTGVYWSRSRNEIWEKGKTSGATQTLKRIDLDCDRDCLRFTVAQGEPGFCHRKQHSCFGPQRTIQTVTSRLAERLSGTDLQSFTKKLADDPNKLRKKLVEEANELADTKVREEVAWEAADLFYFSLVRMIDSGVDVHDIFEELARRLNRVVRRPDKLETKVAE